MVRMERAEAKETCQGEEKTLRDSEDVCEGGTGSAWSGDTCGTENTAQTAPNLSRMVPRGLRRQGASVDHHNTTARTEEPDSVDPCTGRHVCGRGEARANDATRNGGQRNGERDRAAEVVSQRGGRRRGEQRRGFEAGVTSAGLWSNGVGTAATSRHENRRGDIVPRAVNALSL